MGLCERLVHRTIDNIIAQPSTEIGNTSMTELTAVSSITCICYLFWLKVTSVTASGYGYRDAYNKLIVCSISRFFHLQA